MEEGGGGMAVAGEREKRERGWGVESACECCSINSLTMKTLTRSGPRRYTAVMYAN